MAPESSLPKANNDTYSLRLSPDARKEFVDANSEGYYYAKVIGTDARENSVTLRLENLKEQPGQVVTVHIDEFARQFRLVAVAQSA